MSLPTAAGSTLRERAIAQLRDERVVRALHVATFRKVAQREQSFAAMRNAENLRTLAAEIKTHTLRNLPRYIETFITNLRGLGVSVHFAPDAESAKQIICDIARDCGAKLAVKAKSMTTEEVHLNDALAAAGVTTFETDLGEFIVQLDHDRPSHIVTPIIHKDRKQIAAAMQRELGIAYTEDPPTLTRLARDYLRDVFRRADLGISGVNFGIAETGTLCICTNEGNGRMTTTRPRVHVALMGIEKLLPRLADLAVFLKLLSRSSTGQPMTVYTNLITGPRRPGELDGPAELHVVILDNGRSALVGTQYEEVLRCIRCGACLNACPVYRNIGGHAYDSVYPGPIGALVSPLLARARGTPSAAHDELPRASSLCGACAVACPVKIDIPALLVRLREDARAKQPWTKRAAMRWWRFVMQSPQRYALGQRLLRALLKPDASGWVVSGPGPLGEWTRSRDLRAPATRSFRDLWGSLTE